MAGLALIFALGVLISTPLGVSSQPDAESGFPRQAGGTGFDQGLSVATDSQRNIYVTGVFQGTARFEENLIASAGQSDVYIAKYNPNAELLWVRQAGGPANDTARSITIDSSNDIYITGDFIETAEFGDTTLSSSGESDLFIAKYDSDGDLIWAKKAGGSRSEVARAITVDGDGDGIIVGSLRGSATFDNIRVVASSTTNSFFVAKFNPNGRFLWVESEESTGNMVGVAVGTDNQDNIYVAGEFAGSSTFNDGTMLQTGDGNDVFLARYEPNGDIVWAEQAGGRFNEAVNDIEVETNGDFYITGSIGGPADFDGTELTHFGDRDIYVAKYDQNGALQWANSAGGSSTDVGLGVSLSNNDSIVITGRFESTWELDNNIVSSLGESDIITIKYDDQGKLDWSRTAGGADSDGARSIDSDDNGISLIAGFFSSTAEFDGISRTSAGGFDMFIVRYDEDGFLLP